jgi:type IX secretion system PorP/SprF family membrane protein
MSKKSHFLTLLLVLTVASVFGQDEYVVNQTKYTQKINASYFGMNELNRVGVLYNSLKVNNATTMDNKYLFGSMAFPDLNFTIGVDLNSFKMPTTNLTLNLAKLAYVYTIQLGNETFLLPALYVGFGSTSLNVDNLVFEDQLETATGFINTESIDPLADIIANTSYFDMGASFILHSEDYLIGLSLKHLNRPNTSFNQEVPYEKPIQVSVQGGYEFNINPYEFRYLPRYSYLYAYGSVTKFGDSYYMSFSQDFQLGEFSLGFVEQASFISYSDNTAQGEQIATQAGLNNIGLTIGLALENFDFGVHYNFPFRNTGKVFSPSMFELSVIFDFSIYRRNNRGLYKRLQIDNYY